MATDTEHIASTSIHPDTSVDTVRLTVSDVKRSREFYERALGLTASERDDGTLALGAERRHPLVELQGDSSAQPLDRHATGLFHLAILLPTRRDLALALARLSAARWRLDGASDHLVSEALYLSDPDGNGIEIYRDRPREEWRRTDGQIEMATLPLDIDGVLSELGEADSFQPQVPPGTRMGHVHLQVADLQRAEEFYSGILGFDVVVRGYPGALFVSAGGYHHHIGLNTWNSAGSGPPAPGSIGMRSFEVTLPDQQELERVLGRIRTGGLDHESTSEGPLVRDPFGIVVLLRVAQGAG